MKPLIAFMKKEYLEVARTSKLIILVILFVIFGIMNPAIAKLTPWMMKMLSESMAESGLIITDVQVDAMTSWVQFFKNIPMALLAFVLILSDVFTKEYKSGTLLLVLTKGLSRNKIVFAKTWLLLSLWTVGYWICFAITYGYNAYFWDNSIVNNLFDACALWWLFGVWVICIVVLFSTIAQSNTSVNLCTGVAVLIAYLLSVIPKLKTYSPIMLTDVNSLLIGTDRIEKFIKAIVVVCVLCIGCIAASIPVMNKKQL